MSLRDYCKAALGEQGQWFIRTADGATILARRDFSAFTGTRVIWPLASTATDIAAFLSALIDGVKPMLVSPKTPAGKILTLQTRFNAGLYARDKIISMPGTGTDLFPSCLYIMTSGSSGEPKAVAATEQALIGMVHNIADAQQLADVRSVMACLPLGFSSGLINQLFWALIQQRELHLPESAVSVLSALESARALRSEMICLVGPQVRLMADLSADQLPPMDHVRVVNLSGASYPADRHQLIKQLFPNARIYNNYGCTEALPRISVRDVTHCSHDLSGNLGSPVSGTEWRIQHGERCGPLEFRSRHRASGYLRNGSDFEPFPEWIPSGDNAELIDGQMMFRGRNDQLVKLGGERHSLLDIEQAAMSTGISHAMAYLEDGTVTLVVQQPDSPAPTLLRDLQACIRDQVAQVIRPARILAIREWPMLPNGKTDRMQITRQANAQGEAVSVIWQKSMAGVSLAKASSQA